MLAIGAEDITRQGSPAMRSAEDCWLSLLIFPLFYCHI